MPHEDTDFEMRRHQPEQQALFPTEDLVVPESLRKMRKAVAAIHTTASSPEHNQNLNSRRLFDGLIIVAQLDFSQRGRDFVRRVREERIAPLFEVRISDLARLSGIPGKNFERLHDELNLLYEMSFDWNIVGEDSTVLWANRARLLSSLGIGKGIKRGLIRYSMDPDVLTLVLEPSLWATLSLQAMQGLGTAASYSLFQTAWRYVGTQAKVTAALPTKTWIELLVGKSRYVKEENGQTIISYGDFKRRVLLDAIRRVNDIPALSYKLELKEIRQGNRVAKLQFKFIQKQNIPLQLPVAWPDDVLAVLRAIGLDDKEIENVSQAHSSEVVADGILRLKAAETRMKEQGKSIANRKPYFFGILRNITEGADDVDHEQLEIEVRQEINQREIEERQRKVQDGFNEHRRSLFAAWVASLSKEEKERLIKEYRESKDRNPLLSKSIETDLSPTNTVALMTLRVWMEKNRPDELERIFPNPEDKTIEAWMIWRLGSLSPSH